MSDILILKSDMTLHPETYKEIYENVLKDKESGVIRVPNGFEVFLVPEDTKVEVGVLLDKCPLTFSMCKYLEEIKQCLLDTNKYNYAKTLNTTREAIVETILLFDTIKFCQK